MIEKKNRGPDTDEIDIGELAGILWARRWIVVIVTLITTAAGVSYALMARDWFQSEVVLLPADSKSMSGGLGQLGGLASLAGVNLAATGGAQAPLAVLKSRDFAREFIQANDLMPVLLADKWNPLTNGWSTERGKGPPDVQDAVRYFDSIVRSVSDDKKTGLVTLSILWTDPKTGADWANAMVRSLNEKLRSQAEAEAGRNIKYLQGVISAATVPALQQSMSKVLESEMQKALLARGNDEYAFKVIDPATPSKQRAKPKRKFIVAGAMLLGVFLSALMVLVVHKFGSHAVRRSA